MPNGSETSSMQRKHDHTILNLLHLHVTNKFSEYLSFWSKRKSQIVKNFDCECYSILSLFHEFHYFLLRCLLTKNLILFCHRLCLEIHLEVCRKSLRKSLSVSTYMSEFSLQDEWKHCTISIFDNLCLSVTIRLF